MTMTATMGIFDEIAQATVSRDMGPRERADFIMDCYEQDDGSLNGGLTLRDFFLNVSDAEFKRMGIDIDA